MTQADTPELTERATERPLLLWINHYAGTPAEATGTRHFELGQLLCQRGWAVKILASDYHHHVRRFTRRVDASNRRAITERYGDLEISWLWSAPYQQNDWHRAWNWITFGQSVSRYSIGKRPAMVVGSSPHLLAAFSASRLASRWDVPFVFEVRDLWPESIIAGGGKRGPAYYVMDAIARYLYRRADRIIVLAEGTRRYLTQRFGVADERIVFAPNGVDLDVFGPVPTRNNHTHLTVMYAGAHGPANGLMTVIEAAERLRNRREVRFVLVGDGPMKPALREAAERRGLANVEFNDPVPKHEVADRLADADVGLMVLRKADLFSFGVSPNKLFDYFASGLPVVCNVPGEVSEIIRNAEAGEQACDSSAEALAAAIDRIAHRAPEERWAMGEAGRRWVARERDRTILAARLDASLRSLLPR